MAPRISGTPRRTADGPYGNTVEARLARRIWRMGLALAAAGSLAVALLHLLNVYAFDSRVDALNADNQGEGNALTWASASVLAIGAALFALLAVVVSVSWVVYAALAAVFALLSLDDALGMHEHAGAEAVGLLGLDDRSARLIWPLLMLPAALIVLVGVRHLARQAPTERRRLYVSIALLVSAVLLDVALYPARRDTPARELLEPAFVAVEEAIELGASIVFVAALAIILVRQIREGLASCPQSSAPDGVSEGV